MIKSGNHDRYFIHDLNIRFDVAEITVKFQVKCSKCLLKGKTDSRGLQEAEFL